MDSIYGYTPNPYTDLGTNGMYSSLVTQAHPALQQGSSIDWSSMFKPSGIQMYTGNQQPIQQDSSQQPMISDQTHDAYENVKRGILGSLITKLL